MMTAVDSAWQGVQNTSEENDREQLGGETQYEHGLLIQW